MKLSEEGFGALNVGIRFLVAFAEEGKVVFEAGDLAVGLGEFVVVEAEDLGFLAIVLADFHLVLQNANLILDEELVLADAADAGADAGQLDLERIERLHIGFHLIGKAAHVAGAEIAEPLFGVVEAFLGLLEFIAEELGGAGGLVGAVPQVFSDETGDQLVGDLLGLETVVVGEADLKGGDGIRVVGLAGLRLADLDVLGAHVFDDVVHGHAGKVFLIQAEGGNDVGEGGAAEDDLRHGGEAGLHAHVQVGGDEAFRHLRRDDADDGGGDVGVGPEIGGDDGDDQTGEGGA